MQRLKGDGIAMVHAGGTMMHRELAAGETLKLDTGCLMALAPTVDYDIQSLSEWLSPSATSSGALLQFLMTIAVIALFGVIIGYLCSALRYGFQEGFYRLAMVVVNAPT